MEKYKILHIINGLAIGGAEKLLVDTLPIYNKNMEVHLLILNKPEESNIYYSQIKDKVKIYISPNKNPKSLKNIMYIRKILRKENYDIVHSHLKLSMYYLYFSTILLKQKPKLVHTEHNLVKKKNANLLSRKIYKNFNMIVAISEATKKSIIELLKIKESKIKIIYNGIRLENFNKVKQINKYNLIKNYQEEDVILLMVGRFSEQKDQKTIIKAITLLPKNYKLLLVGDGPLRTKAEELSRELGVSHRVFFLGIRKDVPNITKTSDIVIVSSNWEGFGLVAVEGMFSGKPVIGTNVPGLNEVITHPEMLFTVGDHHRLSEIIKKLDNKETLEKILKYQEKHSKNYELNNMINKQIELYKKIVKI